MLISRFLRKPFRDTSLVVVVLALMLPLRLHAATAVITMTEQMPPGLLFQNEQAVWKFNVTVDPPSYPQGEIKYVFSKLEVLKKELTDFAEGETIEVAFPPAAMEGNKIVFKGATLKSSPFKTTGKKKILLQVRAIYKAPGQENQKADSDEKTINLEVGKLEIVDKANQDAVISGTTVKTIVGKKIVLKGRIVPEQNAADISDSLWTIPGKTVKSYKTDVKEGVIAKLSMADLGKAELPKDPIKFYWIDKGTNKVEFQITYKNRMVKTEAKFLVERPISNLTSVTTLDPDPLAVHGVAVGFLEPNTPPLKLHYGIDGKPGILWTGVVTAPNVSGGKIAFVQLAKVKATVTKDNILETKLIAETKKYWLDTNFPYGPGKEIAANATKILQDNDSPGIELTPAFKYETDENEFQTYLMFQPTGDDNIWVTLSMLEWYWTGSATKEKGLWKLSDDPPPDASTDPDGEDSIRLPIWPNNAALVKYKKEG